MKSRRLLMLSCVVLMTALGTACSTTQKTAGHGFTSAKAQTVTRLAGVQAFRRSEMPDVQDKMVAVKVSGFADDQTREMIEYLAKSLLREQGARVVERGPRDFELEVGVMAAGADYGTSRIPLIRRSERTEGTVDVDAILRTYSLNELVNREQLKGEAKHEQSWVLGIQLPEKFFVRNDAGEYERVRNLDDFREVAVNVEQSNLKVEMFISSYCYVAFEYAGDSASNSAVAVALGDRPTTVLGRGEKHLEKIDAGNLRLLIIDPLPQKEYPPEWKPFEINFDALPLTYTKFLIKTGQGGTRRPIVVEMYRDESLVDWWSIPTQ